MGLDIVELFLRAEEEFGVEIPDAEAETLVTVGALYEALAKRVCVERSDGCASQAWFYAVRGALRREFQVERALVIPDMYLDMLLPSEGRDEAWNRFGAALEVALPPMRTRDLTRRETWLAGSIPAGLLCGLLLHPAGWALATVGGLALAVDARDGAFVADKAPFRTVRDLVGYLVLTMTPKSSRRWSRSELWLALQALVVDQLDIDPAGIVPEARWVDDLGVE